MDTKRGKAFEEEVGNLLEGLRTANPQTVKVVRQPRLTLHNLADVIPDYELTYKLPFQTSTVLIECQDREKGSHDVIRKIAYIKANSRHNRIIFVYKDPSLLSASMLSALNADGVTHYSLPEFTAMLLTLSNTLERLDEGIIQPTSVAPPLNAPSAAFPHAALGGLIILMDFGRSMLQTAELIRRFATLPVVQFGWYWRLPEMKSLNGQLFLPKSYRFLQRVFRAARKKKRLGVNFTEEVTVELFNTTQKEEVAWHAWSGAHNTRFHRSGGFAFCR